MGGSPGWIGDAVAPERFQIAVNKIVAEQIGVEIPNLVSHRAAFVYQPEK
jgi:hypothetical protein